MKNTLTKIFTIFFILFFSFSVCSAKENGSHYSAEEINELIDKFKYHPRGWYDPKEQARKQHIRQTLVKVGDKAVPILIERLENATHWGETVEIPYILVEIGDERAIPVLLRTAEKGNLASARALGMLKLEEGVPLLLKLLETKEPTINNYDGRARETAAEALGHIGNQEAVIPLSIRVKDDEDNHVRVKAMIALGRIGDKSVVPIIEGFLEDSMPFVHYEAARALYLLTGKCYPYRGTRWAGPKLVDYPTRFKPSADDQKDREMVVERQKNLTAY